MGFLDVPNKLPDRLSKGSLDATYGPNFAARAMLASKGAADSTVSLAGAQVATADATTYDQQWVDLTGVSLIGTPGLTVSGGQLYGNSTNSGAAMVAPIGARARYRATIAAVTGGGERLTLVGWSDAAPGYSVQGGATYFRAVGVHIDATGTAGHLVTWDNGVETQGPAIALSSTYTVTLTRDESAFTATIATGDGKYDMTLTTPDASFSAPPQQIGFWLSDGRGTTGDYVGRVVGANANVTTPVKTVETIGHSQHAGVINGNGFHLGIPKTFDSRKPLPLVIYCHGYGGNERAVVTNGNSGTNMPDLYVALLDAGYMVASSLAGGGDEVGTGWLAYRDLYRYVRDHYPISQVLIISESFGGISGLRTIAGTDVPNVAGWLGIYPVTNLAHVYANNATLATAIDAKYGSLAAAQAADADPNLFAASRFRGVPMRVYHSLGDGTVLKAGNIDLLAPKLSPLTAELNVITTTGGHGDPSNFVPAEVVAFFDRCIGKA